MIWRRKSGTCSKGEVNLRHIYGHWLLTSGTGSSVKIATGFSSLPSAAAASLRRRDGEAEVLVDEAEGLAKLLSIVADTGPSRRGGLLDEWADYLKRRSAIRSESMIKDTMRQRLANLAARGLVERKGNLYLATPRGLQYLQETDDEDAAAGGDHNQLWALVRRHANTVRDETGSIVVSRTWIRSPSST